MKKERVEARCSLFFKDSHYSTLLQLICNEIKGI